MITKIKQIIIDYPKLFSQIIKRDKDLHEFVMQNTYDTANYSERIYSLINNVPTNLCKNKNIRKFKSLKDGYGYCGRASTCACAKKAISEKISNTKQQYSEEVKTSINAKRKETTMLKYGVENNAQTSIAKANHAKFYKCLDNVKNTVKKIEQTKHTRYGDKHYNNISKTKQTCLEKYNVLNTLQLSETHSNENLASLQDKKTLKRLYKEHSIIDIAENLNVHPQTVYRYLNKHDLRQPFKSSEEAEVVRYLSSLGIRNIVTNTRKLLPSKKEIDIYLPDYNIAIEYNGVYWHHEDIAHITKNYHYDKFKECEKMDIQLITIFSNFWKSKQEVVKNILKSKLGIENNAIYARKCTTKLISTNEAKIFAEKHHVQGYTPSSVRVALEYNNNIVALMTFSKIRKGIGKTRKENTYELVRFCSKGRVVGGAGKLLTYFKRNYIHDDIISYSDNEWSTGNLYQTLGFDLEKEQKPSYWYLRPRQEKLLHRYNFAKHKLVEAGYPLTETETQITKKIGLLKVWDCGKRTWILYGRSK